VCIEGTAAKRLKLIEQARHQASVVVVANYESTRSQAIYAELRDGGWDLLICDESHRLKSPTGADSRHVWMIAEAIPRRLALTGTPMPHSPLDAFAQARVVDPAVLGTAVTPFKSRFAILGGYGGKEIVGWRNVEVLAEKLAQLTYSVGDDVLDLPPLHHVDVDVTLSPPEVKAYRDMAAEGVIHLLETGADVDPGTVTASTILAEMIRLAQITGGATGGVRDALDGTTRDEVTVLGTAKQDRLAELASDDGVSPTAPMVVFCRFRHSLDAVEAVAAELGVPYGELSGRRRDGIDDNARATEGLALIGVQYQSGGVGIDLTRASRVVCFDQTWSLGEFDQAMKRAHRPGQDRPVTVWHLLAGYTASRSNAWCTTIDHRIAKAIKERRNFVGTIMGMVQQSSG
jgi:SNF2 family DNA or RNA helicase